MGEFAAHLTGTTVFTVVNADGNPDLQYLCVQAHKGEVWHRGEWGTGVSGILGHRGEWGTGVSGVQGHRAEWGTHTQTHTVIFFLYFVLMVHIAQTR